MSKAQKKMADATLTLAGLSAPEAKPAFGPVSASHIVDGVYVLGPSMVSSAMARDALGAKQAMDAAEAKLLALLKPLRAYGVEAREACAQKHGGEPLATVKIPYADQAGSPRMAAITVSQRYSVAKSILAQKEALGERFSTYVKVEKTRTVTPAGYDILCGLLAKAGLKGNQIAGAIKQICDETESVSVVEGYEGLRKGAPDVEQKILDAHITKAAASVKL